MKFKIKIGEIVICCKSNYRVNILPTYNSFLSSGRADLELHLTSKGAFFNETIKRKDFSVKLYRQRAYAWVSDNKHSFDSVIRVIYSFLLPKVGGILLHSGGVVVNGEGVLFSGGVGSGKTTLVKHFSCFPALGDEILAVKYGGEGVYVFPTPFSSIMNAENLPIAVASIFFLRRKGGIKKLKHFEAFPKMLKNTIFFSDDRKIMKKIIHNCWCISKRISCFEGDTSSIIKRYG